MTKDKDPKDCDKKDKEEPGPCKQTPSKPTYDPHEYPTEHATKKKKRVSLDKPCESESPKDTTKTTDSKKAPGGDPCAKYYPKGLDEVFKKEEKPTGTTSKPGPSVCNVKPPEKSKKVDASSVKYKIKLPTSLSKNLPTTLPKVKLPTNFLKDFKQKLPAINIKGLKKIEYGKLLLYGYCRISNWIRNNCNPKKMADKGSGAPARPMKYPYTFSAKFAQFPMGHYVKNQWVWKYYVIAFAACVPIFYSINKLANSPGNVSKWAEIRRKEAAEHHH